MKQREIKFRAWDIEEKKFFAPAPRIGSMTISICLDGDIIAHPNVGEVTSLFELQQFTGLLDKNGKEIYEGDILKCGGIVEWFDSLSWEGGGSMHPGYYCKKWLSRGELSYLFFFNDKTEVIGNIYENPELIKQTTNTKQL